MIECQKLELVDRRWDALLNGEKLDTIRFNEARIEPGFLVYENCDKRDKHCVVYVTAVRDIKLSDVLKYTKDKARKPNEETLLMLMKKHYPDIELNTIVQYIEHLSPEQTQDKFSHDVDQLLSLLVENK